MNKILLLLFSVFVVSCVTLKVNNSKIEGIDDFDITIYKVNSIHNQAGWGTRLVPAKGHTFLRLHLAIKNVSNETKQIDVDSLYLCHQASMTKYPLVGAYLPSAINLETKSTKKIKPNKSIERVLLFSFPKKQNPDFVLYKDKLIPLGISY
ncbi:hypothetical protein FXV77_16865 [Sphingobacterium phlebotomi]|uniref:DUF4352 domain-containing protein n=1 Tax=Sphingobacterium phlebotomi TaxID=2605433 RepID=A0A5D4H526_9SPHI|nr:hypothetical protein [Sphingobacterium phlebotomi]TYR33910.1 hypothetical protein FXV77_16865 [Sphingobacterium phlebotomi]